MAEISGLTVKLDLDVSEAITGLKAVQREAKKAAQDLREVESQSAKIGEVTISDETLMRLREAIHAKEFPKKLADVEGVQKVYGELEPKRTSPIETVSLKVSYGGKLPVAPERD